MFEPFEFELIDWDPVEDEEGNLAHCMKHGVDEIVVGEVLRERPVEITIPLITAEFVIAGPDAAGTLWTILFNRSWKRGDWLRPVTGWQSKVAEVRAWEARTGQRRGGRR